MAQLISAKGSDVLAWRAAGDFAATFRQIILSRMEFCRSDQAADLLDGVKLALDDRSAANDAFCRRCETLLEEVATCAEPERLKELTALFYDGLYAHLAVHHSASAFYQYSTLFLQSLTRGVSRNSYNTLGLSARQMPEMTLIALGPAGRQEFSPFCPLQLMLIHSPAADGDAELISRFAALVHECFEACGLRLDETVTPRNARWRGSLADWERWLNDVLERGISSEIVEIVRLAEQTVLAGCTDTAGNFRQMSLAILAASQVATNNLVSRVAALSNGIGIMGGLRFERSGPYRGMFALLDQALQPLSASVSAMALLKRLETTASPCRIRELLWRRDLNVDMAEHLLQAWHTLHELRLLREQEVQPDWLNNAPLYLDVDEMSVDEQESLRESLEAVGTIQRHIGINFSSMGE
jgi:signal-transduction protein with cAMP-binding, CBS, and nucleotidyltransferase domain